MNQQQAIEFLQRYQPLPSGEDFTPELRQATYEVCEYFEQNPCPSCVTLLLGAYNGDPQLAIFKLTDVFKAQDKETVVRETAKSLLGAASYARELAISIARDTKDPMLVSPLLHIISVGSENEHWDVVGALDYIPGEAAESALKRIWNSSRDFDVRKLASEILYMRNDRAGTIPLPTPEESLDFLRKHQPIPKAEDTEDGTLLHQFTKVCEVFSEVSDPRCVPLLLGAIANGEHGSSRFQHAGDALHNQDHETVITALIDGLVRAPFPTPTAPPCYDITPRAWCAQFAITFEDARLIPPLLEVFRRGLGDEQTWAVYALSAYPNPEIDQAFSDLLRQPQLEDSLRTTIEEVLHERNPSHSQPIE